MNELDSSISQLLELLGLSRLGVGKQSIRDQRGWRTNFVIVRSFWYARIKPSFHDTTVLGVASFDANEFREHINNEKVMAAALVVDKQTAAIKASGVTQIEDDPLRRAVNAVCLMPVEQSEALDGIGYEISIFGTEMRSDIQLYNPIAESNVDMVDALHCVLREIGEANCQEFLV